MTTLPVLSPSALEPPPAWRVELSLTSFAWVGGLPRHVAGDSAGLVDDLDRAAANAGQARSRPRFDPGSTDPIRLVEAVDASRAQLVGGRMPDIPDNVRRGRAERIDARRTILERPQRCHQSGVSSSRRRRTFEPIGMNHVG